MSIKYQYVKGRIDDAMDELCIGAGDARERLLSVNDATASLLDIHFPEELLADWHSIQERMTKSSPRTNFEGKMVDGAVAHTMTKIRNSTASKTAEDILKLHKKLQSEYCVIPSSCKRHILLRRFCACVAGSNYCLKTPHKMCA